MPQRRARCINGKVAVQLQMDDDCLPDVSVDPLRRAHEGFMTMALRRKPGTAADAVRLRCPCCYSMLRSPNSGCSV